MIKKVLLIIATIISIYYCFRFGYIWSAYGHGGQLLGVPFVLLMLIITVVYLFKKKPTKEDKTFTFGIVYFLTLAAFSITIELIRNTKEDYFGYLYYEPGGCVNWIFLGWLLIGLFVFFLIIKKRTKIDKDA